MGTKNCLYVETGIGASDYQRAVRQLRIAVAARGQCEDRRQQIRAATQC